MKGQKHLVSQYTQKLKLITIGDSGCGKTCVLLKLIDDKFNINIGNTLGVDFKFKEQKYKQISYKIAIYDTAGQDKFQSLMKKYYQGADAVLVIFSLQKCYDHYNKTDGQIQTERIDYWLHQFKQNNKNQSAKIVFVGNKKDLIANEQGRDIFLSTLAQAFKPYQEQHNTKLFLTSALTGQNIQDSLQYLLQKIYEKKKPFQRPTSIFLHQQYYHEAVNEEVINEEKKVQSAQLQQQKKGNKLSKEINSKSEKKRGCQC